MDKIILGGCLPKLLSLLTQCPVFWGKRSPEGRVYPDKKVSGLVQLGNEVMVG